MSTQQENKPSLSMSPTECLDIYLLAYVDFRPYWRPGELELVRYLMDITGCPTAADFIISMERLYGERIHEANAKAVID